MSDNKNTKYTFDMIAQILKDYTLLRQQAKQLEFEIDSCLSPVSDIDMIDTMTFAKSQGDNFNITSSGHISDKTASIAISYLEKAYSLNMKHKQELVNDLRYIHVEMLRLETYINLLDKKYADILRMLYLEGMTFAQASDHLGTSLDTIKSQRIAGIKILVEMYNRILR